MKPFCDVDGVLVNFVDPSIILHGMEDRLTPTFPNIYDYWGELGLSGAEFWRKIDDAGAAWWANLPKMPWFDELVSLLNELDPEWELATKCTLPSAAMGRLQWIQREFPGRKFHISSWKASLAGPGRLLIDDAEDNCREWERRGGTAILFPAKTNGLSSIVDKAEYIKVMLRCHGLN